MTIKVSKCIYKSDDYSVLEVNVPTGYVATYQENNNIFTITNIILTRIIPKTVFILTTIYIIYHVIFIKD